MVEVKIDLKTEIMQANERQDFSFFERGDLIRTQEGYQLNYFENGEIPVTIEVDGETMTIVRGVRPDNFSALHFNPTKETSGKFVVSGKEIDLRVKTRIFHQMALEGNRQQITLGYQLYNGNIEVGKYSFKLIFVQ